jgi:hypothetical protein
VKSKVVEVLIVKELGGNRFYEVVTWAGVKILRRFEGPRGGGA